MPKKFDFLIVAILPLLAAILSLILKANYLISTVLMFAPASIYLSYKQKKKIPKTIIFTSLLSLPFTLMLDYLITKDLGWYIVRSVFSFRLFHLVPIEQFIWGFLYIYLLISFYERFLDKKDRGKPALITTSMKYFSALTGILLTIFIAFAAFSPDLLNLPYAYFILSVLLGIIPLSLFLFHFPLFTKRFLQSIGYFAYLGLTNEYVSLKLNHWIFPGSHFIGMTSFFGYPIPYEEVFIYFIFLAPILLAYYEFFDDDKK